MYSFEGFSLVSQECVDYVCLIVGMYISICVMDFRIHVGANTPFYTIWIQLYCKTGANK